jgi:hypothetical protein
MLCSSLFSLLPQVLEQQLAQACAEVSRQQQVTADVQEQLAEQSARFEQVTFETVALVSW